MRTLERSGLPGAVGGEEQVAERIRGRGKHSCDAVMADTCRHTFVQTHRTPGARSEPAGDLPFLFVLLIKSADPSCPGGSSEAEV